MRYSSDSLQTDKEAEKKSATLLVPGVDRHYKSTVIAELRNNPELSTDRLRRVWGAGTSMESEMANDSRSTDSNDSVGLFEDCVFYDPTCTGKFVLGQVQRMRKKGTKGFIKYVRPVDISNKPANVKVIASKYCRTSEDSHLYYHQETVVVMPLISLLCKVHLEINQDDEREDDFNSLSEKDTCIVAEFLQSVETQQRASTTPHQRNATSLPVDLEDDGRRVDSVPTSSKRLSRRVSFLTF